MGRNEERLFKLQLERFTKTFNHFTIFQLEQIDKILKDLIKKRKDLNKNDKKN